LTPSSLVFIPLTTALPMMAIAILSVWAAHCAPEASSAYESDPEASSVRESAAPMPLIEAAFMAEFPEEAASSADPKEGGKPIYELTVCSTTVNAPALPAPPRLPVCPVTAMEAVSEVPRPCVNVYAALVGSCSVCSALVGSCPVCSPVLFAGPASVPRSSTATWTWPSIAPLFHLCSPPAALQDCLCYVVWERLEAALWGGGYVTEALQYELSFALCSLNLPCFTLVCVSGSNWFHCSMCLFPIG
ncbi:hypothetical protein M9458_025956, partial [Cirrhinus mrigala]